MFFVPKPLLVPNVGGDGCEVNDPPGTMTWLLGSRTFAAIALTEPVGKSL